MLKFTHLVSGGIITNYYCSSKCRHCVYASSPCWPKDYMTVELAEEIFQFLVQAGCRAVHIGGGEPLLKPEGLFPVLKAASKNGVGIEYIETNASWYSGSQMTDSLLQELIRHNVRTLLISIDPFHNEFIPFKKVKALVEACRRNKMEVFPWMMEFWNDLGVMDDFETHQLEEYESIFGSDYKLQILERYHLNLRGRALETYRAYLKPVSLSEILADSSLCRELAGVYHFHIDLYGNFVPQSCAGISINYRDIMEGITAQKYPVYCRLFETGIKGLYDLAVDQYGFQPKDAYTGKCDLCYDIRRYLVSDMKLELPDLQPTGHYAYI